MKQLSKILIVAAASLISSSAFGFITGIEVRELNGEVRQIVNPTESDYQSLNGKEISYRGRPAEAARLFERIVELGTPKGLTEISSEINEKTGTVSVTVRVSGFAGWDYAYWVLKQTGP